MVISQNFADLMYTLPDLHSLFSFICLFLLLIPFIVPILFFLLNMQPIRGSTRRPGYFPSLFVPEDVNPKTQRCFCHWFAMVYFLETPLRVAF